LKKEERGRGGEGERGRNELAIEKFDVDGRRKKEQGKW
jgi:hypothetical protein